MTRSIRLIDYRVGMDVKQMFWKSPRPPARQPQPGERLFEFVRASDHAPMTRELRFHGESYGWEAQFYERGELLYVHGGFVTRTGGGAVGRGRAKSVRNAAMMA